MRTHIIIYFILVALIRTEAYSQANSSTLNDQQFKLSMGNSKGQPSSFTGLNWTTGFAASIEFNKKIINRLSWGVELGFTFDSKYINKNYNFIYYICSGVTCYLTSLQIFNLSP